MEIFSTKASEFNEKYAVDGDLYLFQNGRLTRIASTVAEPRKPTLFEKVKAFIKSKGSQITQNKTDTLFEKQGEQKTVRQQCADFYNKDSELQMPRLTEFENELANILFDREYEGSTETEDDIQRGKLDYELAAIRLAPKLLSLINIEQKPAEWSEEDEYLLDETIKHLEALIRITKKQGSAYSDETQYYQRDIDWLKSLRLLPKQEWSEEEEKMLNDIINTLTYFDPSPHSISKKLWLKSLRPQKHWKPTEEQIDALENAITKMAMYYGEHYYNNEQRTHLKELFEQLKALL